MKKGFTLIELIIVMAIIGILATTGVFAYQSVLKNSRDAKRKADLEQIRAAVEMFRSNNTASSYPAAGSCGALSSVALFSTYMPVMPSDPQTGYTYYCNVLASDYALGARMEGTSTCTSVSASCGTGGNCNYCVGPYGQKP